MEIINGGVLAAKGFKASGVHCGIRKNKDKKDIALIYSEKKCNAAATYTKNLVKGAPLVVTKNHIYTDITRSKSFFVGLWDFETINKDVEIESIKDRNTLLNLFLSYDTNIKDIENGKL